MVQVSNGSCKNTYRSRYQLRRFCLLYQSGFARIYPGGGRKFILSYVPHLNHLILAIDNELSFLS